MGYKETVELINQISNETEFQKYTSDLIKISKNRYLYGEYDCDQPDDWLQCDFVFSNYDKYIDFKKCFGGRQIPLAEYFNSTKLNGRDYEESYRFLWNGVMLNILDILSAEVFESQSDTSYNKKAEENGWDKKDMNRIDCLNLIQRLYSRAGEDLRRQNNITIELSAEDIESKAVWSMYVSRKMIEYRSLLEEISSKKEYLLEKADKVEREARTAAEKIKKEREDLDQKIQEKIDAGAEEQKKDLEARFHKNMQESYGKTLEMMGIFIAVFSIIGFNIFNQNTKSASAVLVTNLSCLLSLVTLFFIIDCIAGKEEKQEKHRNYFIAAFVILLAVLAYVVSYGVRFWQA